MPRMSARELCVAISVNFDDTTTSPHGIPSVEEVMIHASSFLRLSQDRRYVEFAHFTVEEYLRTINPREKPELARYRWDELIASTYQVETCLTFLNLDNFRPRLCGSLATLQWLLRTHPFYITASVLWSSCPASSRNSVQAKHRVNRLFCPASDAFHFDNWLQIRLLASHLSNGTMLSQITSIMRTQAVFPVTIQLCHMAYPQTLLRDPQPLQPISADCTSRQCFTC